MRRRDNMDPHSMLKKHPAYLIIIIDLFIFNDILIFIQFVSNYPFEVVTMKYFRLFCIFLSIALLLIVASCSNKNRSTASSSPITTTQDTNAPSDTTPQDTPDTGNQATVSGVAAMGVPVNSSIVLKDSSGTQRGPITTDAYGNYSFNVKDLKPPFVLNAQWISGFQSFDLYSASVGTGVANINPFTSLLLQLATNADPATIFGMQGDAPDTTRINESTLSDALTSLRTLLTPLLSDYGISDFNPLTGLYSATPDNKLDTMLDVVSLNTTSGMLTIMNKLNGSIMASGPLADIASLNLDMTNAPDKSVLIDIKDITERVGVLCSVMNLGEALSVNDLEGLFLPDPYYGTSNYHTRAEDMTSIVAIFGLNGTNPNGKLQAIQNVQLISDQTMNYADRGVLKVYLLNYDFIHENGVIVHGNNTTFGKETSTGLWKFIGDPAGSNIGNNNGLIVTMAHYTSPSTTITAPSDTTIFTVGDSIVFDGSGVGGDGMAMNESLLIWTSSIDGQIGTGKSFTKSDLSSGDHVITLSLDNLVSNNATVNISIVAAQP